MTGPATASDRLQLVLVTLDRKVLETECDEVRLPGALGELGILPAHTPMITALTIGELMVRDGASRRWFALAGGFAEISGNVVTVLADRADGPEGIDAAAERRAIAKAEEDILAAQDEAWQDDMRALELARTRLAVAERG